MENQKRYLRWLGDYIGVQSTNDWYFLRDTDIHHLYSFFVLNFVFLLDYWYFLTNIKYNYNEWSTVAGNVQRECNADHSERAPLGERLAAMVFCSHSTRPLGGQG